MTDTIITKQICNFIIHNFLFDDTNVVLPNSTSLLMEGIIDSTGVLDLVMFLEEDFGISVADEDVIPENFDSVDNLAAYVRAKLIKLAA